MNDALDRVMLYHDGTKHHYHRFARSQGYLDWATQPKAFRRFAGARVVPMFPAPGSDQLESIPIRTYDSLYGPELAPVLPIALPSIGFFLRHALGLSAWKAFASSRWALRVNPSSGNLHPTEGYVLRGGALWHYDAEHHALEERCTFDPMVWDTVGPGQDRSFLVALTSIHWRESWKYGERAFRYCHHDIGHAIAALRLSASLCGWRLEIVPEFTHAQIATLIGVDRDEDFFEAEREDPACVMLVTADATVARPVATDTFVETLRGATWSGRASQLSEDHVQWTFIDEVAQATSGEVLRSGHEVPADDRPSPFPDRDQDAARVIVQRRSAVALDGLTTIDLGVFLRMLARLMPSGAPPWDALWWPPRIHLAIFVHRVTGLEPGLYLLVRDSAAEPLLRSTLSADAAWVRMTDVVPLRQLATGDCRRLAQRVSCDQEIAADGAFSLGMIADFTGSLATHGASFYRQLYWECGVIGQVLYLEAEAAGIRGTGIGCFYDDGVHEALGIRDHAIQSLYHFTIGGPVEDTRLTTEAGYVWGD